MQSNKIYYNVRRFKNGVDMGVVDIPEDHLAMTMRNHPEWVNLGPIKMLMEQVTPPGLGAGFFCPICGANFKEEEALTAHRKIHIPAATPQVSKEPVAPVKKPAKNVKKTTPNRKRKST